MAWVRVCPSLCLKIINHQLRRGILEKSRFYSQKCTGICTNQIICKDLNCEIYPSRSIYMHASIRNFNSSAYLQTLNSDLDLSNSCIERIKNIIDSNEDKFLRVVVEGGGCSGFSYKFEMDSTLNEDDRVFEKNGVKVVADETTLEYIKGSTIDYHVELIRSAFRIVNNPQAEKGCSCGVSFSIKI